MKKKIILPKLKIVCKRGSVLWGTENKRTKKNNYTGVHNDKTEK